MLQSIPQRAKSRTFQPIDISIAGAPARGTDDAPVTMVEFTDFECPYCRQYSISTLPKVFESYVDTGKVRYVVLEMPIKHIHPHAQKASEAALCAGDQGQYWAMRATLFENQDRLEIEDLVAYAKAAGLDLERFSECLDTGAKVPVIRESVRTGIKARVSGTPSFFIGLSDPEVPEMLHAVKTLRGAQSFAAFQKNIDALLETLPPREDAVSP
jgi:protein-disulfide isomerase